MNNAPRKPIEPNKPVKERTDWTNERKILSRIVMSVPFVFLVALVLNGCSDSASPTLGEPEVFKVASSSGSLTAAETSIALEPVELDLSQEQDSSEANPDHADPQDEDDGMLGKAARLFDQAKAKSGDSASGASQWVQEKLNGAADASSQSADDSLKWANDTFESLKSQGLTTAQSTSEWLGQDYTNMDSWEYKVITLDGTDEELAAKLNEFGKVGWNCFNTESKPTGTRFYFKKQTFSYMRHLPFKDMIKLVPAMGGEGK